MEDKLEELRNKVYENIGSASMCWSDTPKGLFNSSKAVELAKEIIEAYEKLIKENE